MSNIVNSFFKTRPIRQTLPEYAQVYFDHLFSEYLKLAGNITAQSVHDHIEKIQIKRHEKNLTWDDVYVLDLLILDYLPAQDLVRKAYDMRAKYRSISGSKDYDAYIASKPPDLTTLQLEAISSPPSAIDVTVEVLRADIRYLLKQFYLYYTFLPFREGLREELTLRARNWTFIFLAIITVVVGMSVVTSSSIGSSNISSAIDKATPTLGVVVFAGIIGGCVSMLQRIQSAPSEGDALYNLATITNGWKGISLSPLYGAIFAVLLSVLFTAKIVEGEVFPRISTPRDNRRLMPVESTPDGAPGASPLATPTAAVPRPSASPLAPASPTTSPDAEPTPLASPQATTSPAEAQAAQPSPASAISGAPVGSGAPTPTPMPTPKSVPFHEFLRETGPVTGKDYALLVIWSFIAGFAERLVPDTLNRLVTKNESIQGKSS
jgi:hypothetical protein